jgi:hypothetical protein
MLYHCTKDVERLQKVIADTEKKFVDCLQQIKTLGEDLRVAAQQLVEMVDPQDGGEADERSLLERLRGAPQKVLSFIAEAHHMC